MEYTRASRLQYRAMEGFSGVFKDMDLFLGSNLGLTILTGHPEISFPNGGDFKE